MGNSGYEDWIIKETNSFSTIMQLIKTITKKIDSNIQRLIKKNCYKVKSFTPLLRIQALAAG